LVRSADTGRVAGEEEIPVVEEYRQLRSCR
jgi:hypothetical protein